MSYTIGGYHWNRRVNNFHITPIYLKKTKKAQCTFGLELEITGAGCNAEKGLQILKAMGLEPIPDTECRQLAAKDFVVWATEDGSIGDSWSDGGIEWVTQPLSLDAHLSDKIINWKDGLAKMEELGYKSWDGGQCGLHCHIPRLYVCVNTSNPEDVLTIVFNNCEKELKQFSGRTENNDGFHYCKGISNGDKFWSYKLKTSLQENEQNKIERVKGKPAGDRYHMVNFTNEDTIEFRLMRGTTNYESFRAALQLFYMLAEIARNFSIEDACNVKWAYLIQFAKGMGFKEFLKISSRRVD